MAYYTSKQQSAMYFARKRRRLAQSTAVVALVAAAALLDGETDGFAADFTYSEDTAKMIGVKASGVLTEYAPDAFITNAGTSPKLVYGADGVLAWSPHNMLLQSEDFTQSWSAIATPSATAHTLTDNSASAFEGVGQTVAGVVGATYTATFWVLKDSDQTRFPQFQFFTNTGAGNQITAEINTQTGAKVDLTATNGSSAISDDGIYWKLSLTLLCDHATVITRIYPSSSTTFGTTTIVATGTVTVARVQVNRGTVPTAYLATTTAARYGLAIDHDPVTLENKGLLVEPAATNLALQSKAFGTSPWQAFGTATIAANSTAGPNGIVEADTITFGALATDQRFQTLPTTVATYTISVFAKVASGTKAFRLKATVAATNLYSSNFVATTSWQRFSFSFTGSTTGTDNVAVANAVGGGAGAVIVSDFQVELGTVATSPITTFASSVTRGRDWPKVNLAQFPLGAEYTQYFKFRSAATQSGTFLWSMYGTANERTGLWMASATLISQRQTTGGFVTVTANIGTLVPDALHQASTRYQIDNSGGSLDGGAIAGDTACPQLATLAGGTLSFGERGDGGSNPIVAPLWIEAFVHTARAVPNAELPTWRYAA